jgi:hypothetical protein
MERSDSQLKLLKTYTMTEDRLLAVIKIYREMVDFHKLVVEFANQHPRTIALLCVVSD